MESYLELEWDDLEVAKANLKRIEEHYKQYQDLNGYFNKKKTIDIIKINEKKDWFVKVIKPCIYHSEDNYQIIDSRDINKCKKQGLNIKEITDIYSAQYMIVLYTDEGKPFQFHAPWCGYFESLVSAEIVGKDLETKFTV